MKKILFLTILLGGVLGYSQVGINTTSPNATLDIQSSNQANPENTDGILIPKIDAFPVTDPTVNQQGMLVYLTTQQGSNMPGFYWWDFDGGQQWRPISGDTNNGEFESIGGLVQNTTNIATDNFVFGSTSLDDITGTDDDSRMFFNKGKRAFRAGRATDTQWDDANIGDHSVAIGENNRASGNNSSAFGSNNTAEGGGSVVAGQDNHTSGQSSVAMGESNDVFGHYAVALGRENVVLASYSTALGSVNEVTGYGSMAQGIQNQVSSSNTAVFGYINIAQAASNYSMVAGVNNNVSGLGSVALGVTNVVSGEAAMAFGASNQVSGLTSIALGYNNNATSTNPYNIAMGNANTTAGTSSIAMGTVNNSLGNYSVAIGLANEASSMSEIVIGKHATIVSGNATDWVATDRLFTIGNGLANDNRSNAFSILKNGNAAIGNVSTIPDESRLVLGAFNENEGGQLQFNSPEGSTHTTAFFMDVFQDKLRFMTGTDNGSSNGRMQLSAVGNLGIGMDAGINRLMVNGEASKSIAGSWAANSDQRLKKNIHTIPEGEALQKILQLRGVTYEWNDDKTGFDRPDGIQYGFIAQEIQEVFPEKVLEDSQGYLQTAYGDYDPLYVQAFKELVSKIETLENENEKLKLQVENSTQEMASIQLILEQYKSLENRIITLENQQSDITGN